jgi:3-hydroxyisobutyrate dehydrogenase-like beta-hydroxyacid dehydrogenase
MEDTIGIIGLGNMGSAISTNLVKAGFSVVGFDTDADMLTHAKSNGVGTKGSALEVAAAARFIILSLASPAALHAVTSELADSADKDTILIETGALTIEDKEAARDRVAATGIILLDCPLSGTGHQARAGDLVVFASGDEETVKNVCRYFLDFHATKNTVENSAMAFE